MTPTRCPCTSLARALTVAEIALRALRIRRWVSPEELVVLEEQLAKARVKEVNHA